MATRRCVCITLCHGRRVSVNLYAWCFGKYLTTTPSMDEHRCFLKPDDEDLLSERVVVTLKQEKSQDGKLTG